jgi:hypothetical protein
MRRLAFFTVAALASATVFGQSLLDCIDPEVLRTLLLQGQGGQQLTITTTMPVELSALKVPREFTWIGSAERVTGRVDASTNASQVTTAWRTSLAPDVALLSVTSAMTASGWTVPKRPALGRNVFDASAQQLPAPACREDKLVNVAANTMDGVTYLMITFQRGNVPNQTCAQMARNNPTYGADVGLDRYLPKLEMPLDPRTGQPVRRQDNGWGGGGDSFAAQAELPTADSVGNVARHFAKQMAEQGWSSDASWSGASTAGSSWSKHADASLIHGTLSVTSIDNGLLRVVLSVIRSK